MADVGGPLQYYWRTVSNAEYSSSFIGYWHVLAALSLLSAVFLVFLSVLVYRADSKKGKNRFIALMLTTEAVRCATAMLYWAYSWPESSLAFLSTVRVVYYIMSLQLFFLYVLTPSFYAKQAWTHRLSRFCSAHGLYLLPVFCLITILGLISVMGGTHVAIGDIGWTYCAAAGSGVGSTASGGSMPFDVTCPESWASVYPMTLSSPTLGPLTQTLLFLPTLGAIFAAVVVTRITGKTQGSDHAQGVELRAVRLGFIGKAVLQITSILMLLTLVGVLGESPTLDTHPFNPDEQVPRLLIAIGPLLPTTVVLAALFEGVVFTYAMAKNEVFGIDEKLRKGFTTAVFTGSFALLFLFATEGMEAVFDRGWIGGILIGLPLVVLRKPILTSLERVSKLIMPESYTKDELSYLALYHTAMADGVLSKKERSMLDVQATAYGITPSRVEFLEAHTHARDSEEE
ncbi:MAG TPA: hypothetical protein HA276_06595 [Candidatus Poseidoniaceae archaeon]|nr:MAG: hypothetical protein CBD01_007560 [Euryarchaeota archaeon TMED141]HII18234.1 hypothetical protein [Candidatus Poseidoniaceae archaeon]HII97343.1 hypothetical protein [Candidatus Poseidoniaceae archaeon]